MKLIRNYIAIAALALVWPALAQTDSSQISASDQFILWESQHNPQDPADRVVGGRKFEAKEIAIPAIEFRIDHPNLIRIDNYMQWLNGGHLGPNLVTVDVSTYLPKEVRDSLFFIRDGHKWARWPLSPYDTEFRSIMETYLKDLGVPYEITSHLRGRSTSSRSTLNFDPSIGYEFSSKTSTNATSQGTGQIEYRPYPIRWGHLNRRLSDYYHTQKHRLRNLDVAWEAAMLGLPPVQNSEGKFVDAAVTIRLMDKVARNEAYQMSGFVLNDQAEVDRIAKLAGITSEEFLIRCAKAFGGALIETHIVLGFNVTSAHLQNVRFELDKNYLPTGRMIMLDLSDGTPLAPIMRANGAQQLVAEWDQLTQISNVYAADNKSVERIETVGDNRWLYPFQQNPKAYQAIEDAMADRIVELTHLSPIEARRMVRPKDNMSIKWEGTTEGFMSQVGTRSGGQICADMFGKGNGRPSLGSRFKNFLSRLRD